VQGEEVCWGCVFGVFVGEVCKSFSSFAGCRSMITLSNVGFWEMTKPYIKKKCYRIVEEYVKAKAAEYEKNLWEVLEPELEKLTMTITEQLDSMKKDVNINLRLISVPPEDEKKKS
jgi:hypothetical protein